MSKNQINHLTMRWADDGGVKNVRAEATVSLSDGTLQRIKSARMILEAPHIDPVEQIVERQLADLREKLYAAGFSKAEVAAAEYDSVANSDI